MKLAYQIIVFLFINFTALFLGSIASSYGIVTDWYKQLNKPYWMPHGAVFGIAWTTIMICFSIYLGHLWSKVKNKKIFIYLFVIQYILNVTWNPTFFYFQKVLIALIIVVLLTIVVAIFIFKYWKFVKYKSLLLLPYFLWLLLATSLNIFIYLNN